MSDSDGDHWTLNGRKWYISGVLHPQCFFGAAGVSDDTPLARWYASMRSLRIADGPDEVHLMANARRELAKHE